MAKFTMFEVHTKRGLNLFCTFQEALDQAQDDGHSRWDIKEVVLSRQDNGQYLHVSTLATLNDYATGCGEPVEFQKTRYHAPPVPPDEPTELEPWWRRVGSPSAIPTEPPAQPDTCEGENEGVK